MRKILSIVLLSFFMQNLSAQSDFLTAQKKHTRVQGAIKEKEQLVSKTLSDNSIELDQLNILIVAYKYENEVDIFAKKKSNTHYTKIITYNVCKKSGELGPKRMR